MSKNSTIAAIATAQGVGGIAVIRISGPDALNIADKVFFGAKKLTEVPSHTVHYGFIKNSDGEKIDEVLATVLLSPKTFTREDTVEISTHGGVRTSRAVLDAIIRAGAHMAAPGEFTKRAFLNGRIDLSQAEAVIDIINAQNDLSRRNALSQIEGALSKKIHEVREKLLYLGAQMQVTIDYPDEDLEDITYDDILNITRECANEVKKLLESADNGRIIKNGIKTAIVGKPNAGKSSLLNTLSGSNRAIVTEIAGTTRDVIEESVNLNGIPLVLIDTAGIRDTDDVVEKIGVERSKQSIDDADLVIVVLDASQKLSDEDIEVLNVTKNKKRIILINKTDEYVAKFVKEIEGHKNEAIIEISAKTSKGIDELSTRVKEIYEIDKLSLSDGDVVTNMRHIEALTNAHSALCRALDALNMGVPQDIASIDLNLAMESLGEITGQTVSEDIVSKIFHNFCVGK